MAERVTRLTGARGAGVVEVFPYEVGEIGLGGLS